MKITLTKLLLIGSVSAYAQVGIGTDSPQATLHVAEKRDSVTRAIDKKSKDGILIPRLSKLELATKVANTYNETTNGTIIFVTEVTDNISGGSVAQTHSIQNTGFYYYKHPNWIPLTGQGLDDSNDAWINNPSQSRVELETTSTGADRAANTQVVVTDEGNLGINVENPTKRLEINASTPNNTTDVLRITNLATPSVSTITSTLQIDSQGNVGKKSEENVEGQILRLPLKNLNTNSGNTNTIEFDLEVSSAPNNANNFINMITASEINDITNEIKLPAGIYKYEVKIIGSFNAASTDNSIALTTLVNGNEYSTQNYGSNTLATTQQHYTGFVAADFLQLNNESTIKFSLKNNVNTFRLVGPIGISSARSYRSLILIQRIK